MFRLDVNTPFRSFDDAVERILPFHIFDYPELDVTADLQKEARESEIFFGSSPSFLSFSSLPSWLLDCDVDDEKSKQLLIQFKALTDRYTAALKKSAEVTMTPSFPFSVFSFR